MSLIGSEGKAGTVRRTRTRTSTPELGLDEPGDGARFAVEPELGLSSPAGCSGDKSAQGLVEEKREIAKENGTPSPSTKPEFTAEGEGRFIVHDPGVPLVRYTTRRPKIDLPVMCWKAVQSSVSGLEAALNRLQADGWSVTHVLPHPEMTWVLVIASRVG